MVCLVYGVLLVLTRSSTRRHIEAHCVLWSWLSLRWEHQRWQWFLGAFHWLEVSGEPLIQIVEHLLLCSHESRTQGHWHIRIKLLLRESIFDHWLATFFKLGRTIERPLKSLLVKPLVFFTLSVDVQFHHLLLLKSAVIVSLITTYLLVYAIWLRIRQRTELALWWIDHLTLSKLESGSFDLRIFD